MKYLMIALLLMLILLTGCAIPIVNTGVENTKLDIEIVFVEDFEVLAENFGHSKGLQGMTRYVNGQNGECIIYISRLLDAHDFKAMCIAGHELYHCVNGSYHERGARSVC